MENLFDLYARYDGPLPRPNPAVTGRPGREEMLRLYLHTIRLKRRRKEWKNLAALVRKVKEIRIYL